MPIIAAPLQVVTSGYEAGETLEWHAVDGTITALTGTDVILQPGWMGGDMPPYALTTADLPGDGAVLRGLRALQRPMFFPLYIEAPTHLALRAKIRSLAAKFNPKLGDGQVYVIATDGTARRIPARYSAVMEGANGVNDSGLHWQMYGLTFTSLAPMWLDLTDQGSSWQSPASTPFFDLNLDGRQFLTADSVLGDLTIGNPGDEVAYPVWTIAGTMTAATFTNLTTGDAFTLTYVQTTGTVTVDCRPGLLTVVNEAAVNLWPDLSTNPILWALAPGDNQVDLNVSGTDATTLVTLSFTPRYLTS
jgi:hypothetical protein